jgi:predicted nucleotidyltransferase
MKRLTAARLESWRSSFKRTSLNTLTRRAMKFARRRRSASGRSTQAPMNATPLLNKIAAVFAEHRLEAVMVGNAAAALHGAPVTTLDIDFMFRKTPANLRKLKAVAASLDSSILKPYYPVSDLYRVINEENSLQLDFMSRLHGIRSFEGLRARATRIEFGGHELLVARLEDIIKSKRATGRRRDLAVLDILQRTLDEQKNIGQ